MRRLLLVGVAAALAGCDADTTVSSISRAQIERAAANAARTGAAAVKRARCPVKARLVGVSATIRCRVTVAGGRRVIVPVRVTPAGLSVDPRTVRIRRPGEATGTVDHRPRRSRLAATGQVLTAIRCAHAR